MVRDGGATTHVHFVCQRCDVPIRLAKSITTATSNDYHDLTDRRLPITGGGDGGDGARRRTNSDGADVVDEDGSPVGSAGEQGINRGASLSYMAKVSSKLFDMLSSNGTIDHPLCQECALMVDDELRTILSNAEEERNFYSQFFTKRRDELEDQIRSGVGEEATASTERERDLTRRLRDADIQLSELDVQLAEIEEEEKALEVEEELYWHEYNSLQLQLQRFNDERESIEKRYQTALVQLELLKRTNVYNDTFHIWFDGHFGTINSFRLGRLPNHNVEWSEINSAWGQTLLLLYSISKKIKFEFQDYKLIPQGSFSQIVRLSDGKELNLFASGRFMKWKNLDMAMIAFLDCMRQIKEHLERKDTSYSLPYIIDGDKIGDKYGFFYSIKVPSTYQQGEWTRALKYTLTNLKYTVAWATK